jgi:citrate lyase synthetase
MLIKNGRVTISEVMSSFKDITFNLMANVYQQLCFEENKEEKLRRPSKIHMKTFKVGKSISPRIL